ncbi:seed maturation protein [Senna tora]|uniref:Seed maturation protein n=1 Tax=Senna tora TaxID=362788 RepID=A0A834W8Z1_9FABA|nr:seed maturation protein [Senna tora]
MQSSKEKLSNMASAAKQHVDIYKAKIDEKAEKATARTGEEKVIAHERAKAKEAKAKMELHEAKARHAAEKQTGKQSHLLGRQPVAAPPLVGAHQQGLNQPAAYPSYPQGGNYPINKHI